MRWFWQKRSGYEWMVEFQRLDKRDDIPKMIEFVKRHFGDLPKEKRALVCAWTYEKITKIAGEKEAIRFKYDHCKEMSDEDERRFSKFVWGEKGGSRFWELYCEGKDREKEEKAKKSRV